MRQAVVLAFAAMILSACSEPLEFADWKFPVPEGTPIIELAPVPIERRSGKWIELQQDLGLGDDPGDSNTRFYRASGMAVDERGHSYVLDAGNTRVQVFDADGNFVRSLGAAGQGPGEFTQPRRITVAGDRIVVFDQGNRRFAVWDLDGTYLADHVIAKRIVSRAMQGFDGGVVLSSVEVSGPTEPVRQIIESYDLDGTPLSRFFAVEGSTRVGQNADGRWRVEPDPLFPAFAVDPSDSVYVTPVDEYQVLTSSLDGTPKWALRVAWERQRHPQEFIDRQREGLAERLPDAEIVVREVRNAIASVLIDGHGHLYVVLSVDLDTRRAAARAAGGTPFAVDVYSADGEQLFAGWLDGPLWDASLGDHVYRIGHDDDGEQMLLRYRLVEPF